MEDNEKESLEQELRFLKESFDAEVINKEEYDKATERIERKIREIGRHSVRAKKAQEPAQAASPETHSYDRKETPAEAEPAIAEQEHEAAEIAANSEHKEESPVHAETAVEIPVTVNIPPKAVDIGTAKAPEPEIIPSEQDTPSNSWLWISLIVVLVFGAAYLFYSGDDGQQDMKNMENPAGNTKSTIVLAPAPAENVNSTVIVLNIGKCSACDTERMTGVIKNWFPGIKAEEVSYESDNGKTLADELGLRLLPAYIFDENAAKFSRFEGLKQVFRKTGNHYILNDDASGGKFYFARENIPNRMTLFVIRDDANSQKAISNAQELIDKSNGQVDFEVIDLKDGLAKALGIKTAPTFLVNNHMKFSGVHSANTLKENFCSLNSVEVCKLTLATYLKQ
ncbi:hypothetical protein HYU10_01915 [Candidatus Woesearchaeota archaeon]|nr:hypothetical protein [Candidatus Woesearchaeota archaeon]MBI2661576.1 hypothetical protein [Candidatus Woesearchaeota archaeon]